MGEIYVLNLYHELKLTKNKTLKNVSNVMMFVWIKAQNKYWLIDDWKGERFSKGVEKGVCH